VTDQVLSLAGSSVMLLLLMCEWHPYHARTVCELHPYHARTKQPSAGSTVLTQRLSLQTSDVRDAMQAVW
jgi:hypothetical protein